MDSLSKIKSYRLRELFKAFLAFFKSSTSWGTKEHFRALRNRNLNRSYSSFLAPYFRHFEIRLKIHMIKLSSQICYTKVHLTFSLPGQPNLNTSSQTWTGMLQETKTLPHLGFFASTNPDLLKVAFNPTDVWIYWSHLNASHLNVNCLCINYFWGACISVSIIPGTAAGILDIRSLYQPLSEMIYQQVITRKKLVF